MGLSPPRIEKDGSTSRGGLPAADSRILAHNAAASWLALPSQAPSPLSKTDLRTLLASPKEVYNGGCLEIVGFAAQLFQVRQGFM